MAALREIKALLRGIRAVICAVVAMTALTPCAAQKIGVAMTGDGALAFYNIGVLKALEERGVRVDVISATGVSAYIAALYAIGRSPAEIEVLADRLGKAIGPRSALTYDYPSDADVWRLLIEVFGPFDLNAIPRSELRVGLMLETMSILTGTRFVFSEGALTTSVRAAMSSSFTVEPTEVRGQRLRQVGSGGLQFARSIGADVLIYVDTRAGAAKSVELADAAAKIRDSELTLLVFEELANQQQLAMLMPADLLVKPTLSGASGSDFSRVREFVEAGYTATKASLDAGRTNPAFVSDPKGASRRVIKAPSSGEKWTLDALAVSENEFIPKDRVLRDFPLKVGMSFTIPDLLRGLDALRQTGFYRSLWVEPSRRDGKLTLTVFVKESGRRLPPEAFYDVTTALASPDILVRRRAAAALGAMTIADPTGDASKAYAPALQPLTALVVFNDKDPGVRRRFAASLGEAPRLGRRMLGSLVKAISSDGDESVRQSLATAIARIALVAANDATPSEIEQFELGFRAMRNLEDVQDATGTLQLSLQRMRERISLRTAAGVGGEIVFEGGIPADLAGAQRASVNGSPIAVQLDPTNASLRFLGGDAGALKPGLNLVGAGRYWLEEKRLTPFTSPYAKSYAIVAAIDDYARGRDRLKRGPTGHEPLTKMVDGARRLVQTLRKLGFPEQNIIQLYDEAATSEAIETKLKDFWAGGKFADADRLVFYFGGHGDVHEGLPFVVTYDYDKARPTATTFQMNDLSERQARNLQPRHVLFALDACHAGLSKRLGDSQLQEEARMRAFQRLAVIRRDTEGKARNLLVAGTGDQRAIYKNGGIFTTALVAGLEGAADLNKDGVIQFEELLFSVRNRVTAEAAATGVRQDPDGQVLDLYGPGRVLFMNE